MLNSLVKHSLLIFFIMQSISWVNAEGVRNDSNMPTIDVYRTHQLTRQFLQDKYANDIKKLSELMYNQNFFDSENVFNEFNKLHALIIEDIKKHGHFAYVGLSVIRYPKETSAHCTIDLVDQDDANRIFQFLPPPQKHILDPAHLIKNWIAYQKAGFRIFSQTNDAPIFVNCPAHHCLFGFDDKRLQKYGRLFVKLVPRNQRQLITVLREDSNPEKRAAAAFLLAHIRDGGQLVNDLLPSIFDANSAVRNAVMRVIGSALLKNPYLDFPKDLLLKILDFPETSNRNKALGIVNALVTREQYANYIKQHALNLLLEELQKLQPNVHNLAYAILKQVSGKNYGERDYKAWAVWINQQTASAVT